MAGALPTPGGLDWAGHGAPEWLGSGIRQAALDLVHPLLG